MLGEGRASASLLASLRQDVDGTPSRAMTDLWGAVLLDHHALILRNGRIELARLRQIRIGIGRFA
jgi:hypothetical protein